MLPPELADLLDAADPAAREAAWKTFLETHSRLLLHTARTLGRDYDATMDAYAYLLEQLRCDDFHRLRAYTTQSRCKFTTWLVVVVRRLCLDRLRQRYGRHHRAEQQSDEAHGMRRRLVDLLAEALDASELPDPADANPETELRTNELNRALLSALMGLEPRDRLLLKLRFADGLAAREIGQVMGFTTPFHVYRRLKALLRELRTALARRGIRDPEP
ncbi:MAG TPA: sigma-70 family RNA polymerase sigma factor [Gemmatimonadales bacterium]|nr:sigma-70 family RNA polymerase sigma factor [Gemmatimonadales bacterium]